MNRTRMAIYAMPLFVVGLCCLAQTRTTPAQLPPAAFTPPTEKELADMELELSEAQDTCTACADYVSTLQSYRTKLEGEAMEAIDWPTFQSKMAPDLNTKRAACKAAANAMR